MAKSAWEMLIIKILDPPTPLDWKLKAIWADLNEKNMRANCAQAPHRLEAVSKVRGGEFEKNQLKLVASYIVNNI